MSEFDKPRFRRVVPREASRSNIASMRPAEIWTMLKTYFGFGRKIKQEPIDSPAALARFIDERASFVAQTSLYGYLRTRAGMRYPELFDDDSFVAAINIAKWHLWLDCLMDLTVFAGSRIAQQAPRELPHIRPMMEALVETLLTRTGVPQEAGPEFETHVQQARNRLARTDWLAIGDDEAAFAASPAALVRWAPIMDELKTLDENIVLNSIRFRWQEVRRHFLQHLQLQSMLRAIHETAVSGSQRAEHAHAQRE